MLLCINKSLEDLFIKYKSIFAVLINKNLSRQPFKLYENPWPIFCKIKASLSKYYFPDNTLVHIKYISGFNCKIVYII